MCLVTSHEDTKEEYLIYASESGKNELMHGIFRIMSMKIGKKGSGTAQKDPLLIII